MCNARRRFVDPGQGNRGKGGRVKRVARIAGAVLAALVALGASGYRKRSREADAVIDAALASHDETAAASRPPIRR